MNKNILSFVPAELFKAKGPHEYAGACPLCGGATKDGFIVWPDRPHGGAFLCRKCGARGDGIAFLMQRDSLTYREACAALGVEPKHTAASYFPARREHVRHSPARPAYVPPKPKPATLPCTEWTDSAAAFLAESQRDLETSPEALLAVTGRFLTPDTAHRVGIGWNPTDLYPLRKSWGLPDIAGQDGKLRTKLLLPRGLVIATRRKAGIVALTVRCPNDRPEGRPKYWQIKGSADVPFVAGRAGLPVVLVESALDAALVWQESFGELAAVALMGNMKGLDADTHAFIQAAPILLACPDNDEGGQSAWQRWSAAYPQAILVPAVGAKDLGEQHAAALSWPINEGIPTVGEWLSAALSIALKTPHTSTVRNDNAEDAPNYGAEMKAAAKAA